MNDTLITKEENLLSVSAENTTINMTGNQIFKLDHIRESFIGESVNNYFKSMKEIEAEFITNMNAAKTTLKNMLSDLSHFGQNLIYMDGEINFPDPDDIHQGYMEENY